MGEPAFVQVNNVTWVRPEAVETIQESLSVDERDQCILTLNSGAKVVCNCTAAEMIEALGR